MGKYRSKEDDLEKISVSMFINNIPDSYSAKELFNACKKYGHVVDSFIPNKRSKTGNRLGFVKFINVFNKERLVDNLGTVWIGSYRLHANLAKFRRPTVGEAKKVGYENVGSKSNRGHVEVDKGTNVPISSAKYPDGSFVNVVKVHDFVSEERVVWVDIEGVPLKFWSRKMFVKIGKKWGEAMDIEESLHSSFARKRLCIKTNLEDNILEMFKVVFKGAAEFYSSIGWVRTCSKEGLFNSDEEGVPDTIFEDTIVSPIKSVCHSSGKEGLADLSVLNNFEVPTNESCNGKSDDISSPNFANGGSFLDVLDGLVRVGQSTGYKMDGCLKDLENIIGNHGDRYSFTWSHPFGKKMSKLDRFLVSEGIVSLFPSISATCLDKHLSDHRPILLHGVNSDFGPSPFRMFHSWFRRDGFDLMVEQAWCSFSHNDGNYLIRFKKKLQALKTIIRRWIKSKNLAQSGIINSIKKELIEIDKIIDSGSVNDDLLLRRLDLSRQLFDTKHVDSCDRDENSKYFHGIINKKRSQLAIRGVLVDGDWCIDPGKVKDMFKQHFAARFKKPNSSRFKLNFVFPNRLSDEQVENMDRLISRDEIKNAVWSCAENKSLGPNGYTFEFFRRYWNFIGLDLCSAVECFFDKGSFPMGNNASFIALIPKVSDAKYVTDYRPISLIGSVYKVITKVLANRLATVVSDLVSDTQSAFVANRQILDGPFILNEVLQAFGFGPNWCKWVWGTLFSAMASVLINGSPSEEFAFYRGLKINILKSHIMGVGVADGLIHQAASLIGCAIMKTPFRYLRVLVGNNSLRCSAWGRLTLLKSVLGASPIYNLSIYKAPITVLKEMERIRSNFFKGADNNDRKISWVSWDKVLASKKVGGLGVSSYYALNCARILKWVWRFVS
nr:RNA-directed DNA polymerase, eukaryota [Tanacetum cinerariifolium]